MRGSDRDREEKLCSGRMAISSSVGITHASSFLHELPSIV
jgi:hypothetical protein